MSNKPGSTAIDGVIAVARTDNKKTGKVAATYVSQATCPTTCPFLNNGCYAESGAVSWQTKNLNKSTATARQANINEARAVDRLPADRDLRLHVVGDAPDKAGALRLALAATRYIRRALLRRTGWVRIWTYTHNWRTIPREAWGTNISVLASCESGKQVVQARAKGYATALVVPGFESEKAYIHDGIKILPCPEQTRGIQCNMCRLCLNDGVLIKAGITIAFAAHGHVKKVKEALRGKKETAQEV